MKYSEIKRLKSFCESLHSEPEWREVLENILSGETDFEVDEVRFINFSEIDRIQCEELESDDYILGCFNAWFLSDVLEIDEEVIKAMQEAEAFEAIGKLIKSMDKLEELQADYSSTDGYGHHFNHYDGGEEEFHVNGNSFYVFDNH